MPTPCPQLQTTTVNYGDPTQRTSHSEIPCPAARFALSRQGQGFESPRLHKLAVNPPSAHGRGCTSTLGGRGDGSGRVERRTMLKAMAPAARTAAAAPAITQGRLP
jgi:hypothetical protein